MRIKATTVLSFILVAAALGFVPSRASAQTDPPGVDPTHYWSYRLWTPFASPQSVGLSDQFFPGLVPNSTDSLTRLLNWVYKDANGVVKDTLIHYTWWNLLGKHPANKLTQVTNQFGSFQVSVVNMEFLLAPAWKNFQSPIPGGPLANHYLCYRAVRPPPQPQPHYFQDEWRQDIQDVGPLEFLCTPCAKFHNGQLYPPVDTLTHLAVYRILPHSDAFFALMQDQFGHPQSIVQQSPPEYLFVPSLKYEINTPTIKNTWGKLKTLYR